MRLTKEQVNSVFNDLKIAQDGNIIDVTKKTKWQVCYKSRFGSHDNSKRVMTNKRMVVNYYLSNIMIDRASVNERYDINLWCDDLVYCLNPVDEIVSPIDAEFERVKYKVNIDGEKYQKVLVAHGRVTEAVINEILQYASKDKIETRTKFNEISNILGIEVDYRKKFYTKVWLKKDYNVVGGRTCLL